MGPGACRCRAGAPPTATDRDRPPAGGAPVATRSVNARTRSLWPRVLRSCADSAATSPRICSAARAERDAPSSRASRIRRSRTRTLPAPRAIANRDGARSGKTRDRRKSIASGRNRIASRSAIATTIVEQAKADEPRDPCEAAGRGQGVRVPQGAGDPGRGRDEHGREPEREGQRRPGSPAPVGVAAAVVSSPVPPGSSRSVAPLNHHRPTTVRAIPAGDVASGRDADATTGYGPPFTVAFPTELDARKDGDAWWVEVDGRELRLSNLNKVFWTNEGYTKGDLISYYWNVAQLIGPYLDGRPLTMKRMPDGAEGPFFYEKTAPSHAGLDADARSCPRTRRRVDRLPHGRRPGHVALRGQPRLHRDAPAPSRCDDVAHPDYFFFDLDPFEPYTRGRPDRGPSHQGAARPAGIAAYPKTSGATGLQIYVPVKRGAYTATARSARSSAPADG